MNVTCPNCATIYRVDPAKVPEAGIRARCAVCNAVFAVRRESEAARPDLGSVPATLAPPQMPAKAEPAGAEARRAEPIKAAEPAPPQAVIPPQVPSAPPRATEPQTQPPAPPAPAISPAQEVPTPTPSRPIAPLRPANPFTRPASTPAAGAAPVSTPAAPAAPARPTAPGQAATVPAPPASRPTTPASPPSAPAPRPAATPGTRPPNPFLSQDPTLKARRLARALISDMVVYHPGKRQEGLRDGNLKELFEEEIKKSWEEFAEQVGRDVAESTTYFREALNEILAGGRQIF